jgi:hypothetical protein
MNEHCGQMAFFSVNCVHFFFIINFAIMDQEKKSLVDQMNIEIRHGSGKNAHMINSKVSMDVLKIFIHLPNLKRVEPYVEGKSICVFDSKMNFE